MARKTTPPRRRTAPAADTMRLPVWVIAAGSFCAIILLLSAWKTYQHGREWMTAAHEKLINATADAGLRVQDIYIEGQKDLSREQLLDKVGAQRGMPLLAVDTHAAQVRLLELPPVHAARVMRLWPDRVLVQIQERVPIALWQKDGKLSPIDSDGVVLAYQRPETLTNLPIIVGDDAPQQAHMLLGALDAYPELKSLVRGGTYISDRRWDLFLKSGVQIKLPEGDVRAALKRLMAFADEHAIFDKPIATVDLRLQDRVVVRPLPEAQPQPVDTKPAAPKQQI